MCVQRHQLTFTHSQAISHFKLSIWYRFVCAKAPTHIHSHTSKALSNHQWCRRLKCRRDTHTKSGATQKAGAHTKGWYTHKRLVHTLTHTLRCARAAAAWAWSPRGEMHPAQSTQNPPAAPTPMTSLLWGLSMQLWLCGRAGRGGQWCVLCCCVAPRKQLKAGVRPGREMFVCVLIDVLPLMREAHKAQTGRRASRQEVLFEGSLQSEHRQNEKTRGVHA